MKFYKKESGNIILELLALALCILFIYLLAGILLFPEVLKMQMRVIFGY